MYTIIEQLGIKNQLKHHSIGLKKYRATFVFHVYAENNLYTCRPYRYRYVDPVSFIQHSVYTYSLFVIDLTSHAVLYSMRSLLD